MIDGFEIKPYGIFYFVFCKKEAKKEYACVHTEGLLRKYLVSYNRL